MILSINSADRGKIVLGLSGRGVDKCFTFETERQSEDLLIAIDGIFKKEKLSLKELKAILVCTGPGTFTGLRAGITIGNTLAWVLNIPIFGFKRGGERLALKKCKKPKKSGFLKIALPYYPK